MFHDYANITRVCIDRPGERLVVEYDIEACPSGWSQPFDEERLTRLLQLCYNRGVKLDLERKYNRHYGGELLPFRRTEISFHFHHRGTDLRLDVPKIVMDDLVLPEATGALTLVDKQSELDPLTLVPRLKKAAGL